MQTITAHSLVKNEENFIWYSIKSIIDYVDHIIVYDTGSTDGTVEIIKGLAKEYPKKIIFEEKGKCDKKRHTELRQEMLDRTTTGWFMILDGDEVWTKRGMEEAIGIINSNKKVECLIAPFYLCVGNIYHKYYKNGDFEIFGKKGFFSPRFVKKNNVSWGGDYGADTLYNKQREFFFNEENSIFLKNKYWHLTHLERSSKDSKDYSSGENRAGKRRLTHFLIGKKIDDNIPEIFGQNFGEMGFIRSFFNFLALFKVKALSAKKQFLKYFIIGVSGVFLDITTLYFLKEYFDFRPVSAVVLNQVLILNYVFFLNKSWSFGSKGATRRQMTKFYILAGFNYIFSVIWMWILNEKFLVNYLLARVINIALAVSWNFLLYKFWVFTQSKSSNKNN